VFVVVSPEAVRDQPEVMAQIAADDLRAASAEHRSRPCYGFNRFGRHRARRMAGK
jgi:hypothetical protein